MIKDNEHELRLILSIFLQIFAHTKSLSNCGLDFVYDKISCNKVETGPWLLHK